MGRFAAKAFLPGIGHDIELGPFNVLREGSRGRIADNDTVRVRLDPVCIRHAHTRGRAVPSEDDVRIIARLGEIRQLAIVGAVCLTLRQLQLLGGIGDPVLAEAFPGEHVHGLCAQHGPHAHLDGTGIRRGHDRHAIIVRNTENGFRPVNRGFQLLLRITGTVRAAKSGGFKFFEGKSGTLCSRTGRKVRACWQHAGFGDIRHLFLLLSSQIGWAPLGAPGPPRLSHISKGRANDIIASGVAGCFTSAHDPHHSPPVGHSGCRNPWSKPARWAVQCRFQ